MNKFLFAFCVLMFITLTACNGNINGNLEVSGNIEATNIVVSSQVVGKVIKILQDEGAKVNKGDTIIIIDPEAYELKLQASLAAKDAAEAQYNLLKKGSRQEDVNQAEENLQQAKIVSSLRRRIRCEWRIFINLKL